MEFGLALRPLCCFLPAVVRFHGLSVYMILTVAMVTALLPLASASGPCVKPEEVNENWRSTDAGPQGSNYRCDQGRFVPTKWYHFNIDGSNATIPKQCIKNKYCGTNIAMRIEMSTKPDEGQIVEAFLCGSYDVLGQYDCCVLRTPVRVSSCGDRLVYQFYQDFDRCDVAVCALKDSVPPQAIAKMGEPYTDSLLNVTDGETTTPVPSSPSSSQTSESETSQNETISVDPSSGQSEVTTTSVSSTEVTSVNSSTELATETLASNTETSASITDTSASTTETSASTTETSASNTETGYTTEISASTTETSASTTETSAFTTETSASTTSANETHTTLTSQDNPPSQNTSETEPSSTSEQASEITTSAVTKETPCSEFDTTCQTSLKGDIDTTTPEAKNDSMIIQDAPQALMSPTASSSTAEDTDSTPTLDFNSTLAPSTNATDADTTTATTTTLTDSTAATSDSSTEADDQNTTSPVSDYPPAAEPTKKDDITEPPISDVTTQTETTEESTTSYLSSPPTPPPHSHSTASDTPVMTTPQHSDSTTSDTPMETSSVSHDIDISTATAPTTSSTTSSIPTSSFVSSSSSPSSSYSTSLTTAPSPRSTSPPPSITTEAITTQPTTTREPRDDVTITENMRLVFDGNYTNLLQAYSNHLVSYVYRILNNFLSRITYEAQPRWRFNISDAPLPSMGHHEDKTYVDVTITHNSGKFSREIFDEHDLVKYFKDHTNLTLLTTCRTGQSCETTLPVAQPTVFKKHAPVFIAVIILCSVCVLLIVVGLAWARFWRRGTYKAGENVEARVVTKDRPYYNATPSPFSDEQIMKDEVVEPSSKQPDTPMRDDEMNGNGDSTWVIPLDDAPATYNTEDTKF